MRHRIIQYQGKRYSLKLDEIVWQSLEEAAAEEGLRLNQLVASIADGAGGNSTVTGALRLFCLRRSMDRVRQLEDQVRQLSLASRGVPVTVIADACPAPCLVVSRAQAVLHANAAALRWMAVDGKALIGKSIEHYFQIKSTLPLADIVERFARGEAGIFPARIVYLRPGRVIMARANLCPAMIAGPDDLAYLVLIDTAERG
jgi:predicted DNA-binding ribbon-helix-helix protein